MDHSICVSYFFELRTGVETSKEGKEKGRGIGERGFSPSPRLRPPPLFAPATQANPWLTIQLWNLQNLLTLAFGKRLLRMLQSGLLF